MGIEKKINLVYSLMDIAVVTVGKKQIGKYSNEYQCVKVIGLLDQKIYTLNIGSVSARKFEPFLDEGNVFFGVEVREDNRKVIDVTKGFKRVKVNK